jgi:HEAT repeat protein
MGLLASCFVLLLVPQEPSTPPAPPGTSGAETPVREPTAQEPANDNATDKATLAAQEKAGAKADGKALAQLATSRDAAVATRAAWLLAQRNDRETLPALHAVVAESPHADARLQAMLAIEHRRDVSSTTCAIAALRDGDRRVRTLAAQLLGKLRRPTALDPLLAMIDDSRTTAEKGTATDLQAALIALADLDAAPQLLRAATALHDSKAEGTGQALAYCCQVLSPKLPANEQSTFLVAILGHREPLVRRYAIGRLAELRDAATAAALEARLATETDDLRPLVEVALAQVRQERVIPSDEVQRATHNAQALWHTAKAWWSGMDLTHQAIAASVPVAALLLLVLALRWRRRSADAAVAAETIALVAPSAEFAEHAAAEAAMLESETDAMAEQDDVVAHR